LAAPSKLATVFAEPLPRLLADLANSPAIRDALQWFNREKQSINEQHLQICRVAAPTFFEQPRAEWMLAQFRSLGMVARMDRGGNVIAHPIENRQEGSRTAL
jgi:tripeptide aminopeptidase